MTLSPWIFRVIRCDVSKLLELRSYLKMTANKESRFRRTRLLYSGVVFVPEQLKHDKDVYANFYLFAEYN